MQATVKTRSRELLNTLREDEHADELLRKTEEDAELGRMLWPVPLEASDLEDVLLHPRWEPRHGVTESCAYDFDTGFQWNKRDQMVLLSFE